MKQGVYLVLGIMAIIFIIAGCSNNSPFGEDLGNAREVLVKGEKLEKKITDAEQISNLVDILNKSKAIDPPEKAKGIKPEVLVEIVMFHFPKADFFYIGDGYLNYANNGKYYKVSKDIEKYIIEQ